MTRIVCDACNYDGPGPRVMLDDRACPQCGEASRIRTALAVSDLSDQEAELLCEALEKSVAPGDAEAAMR